jgi:hypothetical protein
MLARSRGDVVEMFSIEVEGPILRTRRQRMTTDALEEEPPEERRLNDVEAAETEAEALAQRMIAQGFVDPASSMMSGLSSRAREPVVYDKADWHVGTCVENALAEHQAFVHTGLFIAWLVDRGFFVDEFAEGTDAVVARKLTGPQFYERLDGAFLDEMLTDEGNAFTQAYFDLDAGQYLADYAELFAIDDAQPASAYSVADTWESYEKLRPRIDERYEAFRAARRVAAN